MKHVSISPRLKRLVSILNDSEYHSGTEIGNELGLTRSGVWKLARQLEILGIKLESVTNKGYKMINTLDLLDKTKIKKHISKTNLRLLNEILIFDDLPSTNDYLVGQARQHRGDNAACLAEQQTAGRGRLGRQWISPFAANIYLSLLWHFSCDISELPGLNIVAGISAAEAILGTTSLKSVKLKWPNDIFWKDQKLGGILIDVIGEYSGGCAAVIGIGLNVNMPQASASQIQKPWTDIHTACGSAVSRNQLTGALLDRLITNLAIFQEHGITDFISRWNKMDYLSGKQTTVKSANKSFEGIAQGINEQGHLLLKTRDGELTAITTGDATIV